MVKTDEERLIAEGVIGEKDCASRVIYKALKSIPDSAMMVQANLANTHSIWIVREGMIQTVKIALDRCGYHKDIDYAVIDNPPYYDVIFVVVKDPTDYSKGMYQYRIKEWKK